MQIEGEVIKKGWLTKEGIIVPNWKKRFFVLTPICIYYFKSENAEKAKGTILLDEYCFATSVKDEMVNFSTVSRSGKKKTVAIFTNQRVYFIRPIEGGDSTQEWADAINGVVNKLRAEKNKSPLDKVPFFCTYLFIRAIL
jgi:hypothetical protein